MRFHIPIKLPSLANIRLHWRRWVTLKKSQKRTTKLALEVARTLTRPDRLLPRLPLLITITRIGPHPLDDDNLASACKYVRDAIADVIGVDDGSDQYTWRYEQKVGKYGVDVEITSRG